MKVAWKVSKRAQSSALKLVDMSVGTKAVWKVYLKAVPTAAWKGAWMVVSMASILVEKRD